MKRAVKFLSLSLLSICLFIFVSCVDSVSVKAELLEKSDKLVVIKAVETGGSLEDALKALKNRGDLDYEGTVGDYGLYLSSLNGYEIKNNEFFAIYSTLGEYEGVSYTDEVYGTYDYEGHLCASASYGASGLPLVKDEIYVITVSTY